ncbi:hypothetical protein BBH88_17860 [Planococcus antarcticus DSM 14505]|uniref:Uncharacterized protein n=1 Tax=Planococcus antarcticus DSM 14505 TaxID=1185653 RepID=A0ABM6D9A5_9BACL|nr:hypothetical protein [Planococcus antarcticus]ANU11987.1 hypothetical protein BBH88_17860 [Planococcus antarcticus DSM 14505]
MENRKSKLATWLKEPIFTKKVDPFLNLILAFLGALIGTTFYHSTNMPYWEFIIWLILVASLAVFILKLIGTEWRKRIAQRDAN